MGVKGLWKEVSPALRSTHLSEFKGQRIGVDAYGWLHRAALASAAELQEGRPSERFISHFMSRLDMVVRCGVCPVLVFDGRSMPMKASTDADRKRRRDAAVAEAVALRNQGRHDEAARQLGKSLDVTCEMAYAIIQVAKERGVACIVAPYEADAQLAFLCKEGFVQAVISEDSDLLVYNCPVLIAKLDSQGSCDLIRMKDLPQIASLSGLSYEAFVLIAILAGCDYVSNLPGIGIKSALKAVAAATSTAAVVAHLANQAGLTPREQMSYEEAVHKAFYCFMHHLVYNPIVKHVEPLVAFPSGVVHREDLLGSIPASALLAQQLCETHQINPETDAPYENSFAESVSLYWVARRGAGQRTLLQLTSTDDRTKKQTVLAPLIPRLRDRDINRSASCVLTASRTATVSRFFCRATAEVAPPTEQSQSPSPEPVATPEAPPLKSPPPPMTRVDLFGVSIDRSVSRDPVDDEVNPPMTQLGENTLARAEQTSDAAQGRKTRRDPEPPTPVVAPKQPRPPPLAAFSSYVKRFIMSSSLDDHHSAGPVSELRSIEHN